ncbi:MAG: copper resistance family protein, partial [Candidatus Binatus sp.]|nr:copper resistance family protein [Candidatus Binatus sp.]
MSTGQIDAAIAWPLITSTIVIFGTSAFVLFFAPPPEASEITPLESLSRLWLWLAIVNLAITFPAIIYGIANMADTTIGDVFGLIPRVMRETVFGHLWAVRLPLAVGLLLVTTRYPSRPVVAIVCGLSASMLLIQSLASHALDSGGLAIAIYFIHQASAGTWIGALIALLLGARHQAVGSRWLEMATPRVSTIAAWSVAALATTGAITAWNEIGWHFDLLVYSLYGRILTYKLATAGAVILVGGYNR